MKNAGCYFATKEEKETLQEVIFVAGDDGKYPPKISGGTDG